MQQLTFPKTLTLDKNWLKHWRHQNIVLNINLSSVKLDFSEHTTPPTLKHGWWRGTDSVRLTNIWTHYGSLNQQFSICQTLSECSIFLAKAAHFNQALICSKIRSLADILLLDGRISYRILYTVKKESVCVKSTHINCRKLKVTHRKSAFPLYQLLNSHHNFTCCTDWVQRATGYIL